jgi:hypothetical protein
MSLSPVQTRWPAYSDNVHASVHFMRRTSQADSKRMEDMELMVVVLVPNVEYTPLWMETWTVWCLSTTHLSLKSMYNFKYYVLLSQ